MSKLNQDIDLVTPFTPKNANKVVGKLEQHESLQAAAATLASDHLWLATFDGFLGDLYAVVDALPGAGESMVYDVLKNGSTVLSSTLTVDDTHTSKGQIPFALDPAERSFVVGDVFTVARTYTAGAGNTEVNKVVAEPSNAPYVE